MDRAGNILKKVFSGANSSGSAKYVPLFDGFQTVIGDKLAPHIMLSDIQNNTLFAEVRHPGWLQAVLLQKAAILKKINKLYPGCDIKDMKVTITKKASPAGRREKTSEAAAERADRPESAKVIEDLLSRMDESELKRALRRLFTAKRAKRNPEY